MDKYSKTKLIRSLSSERDSLSSKISCLIQAEASYDAEGAFTNKAYTNLKAFEQSVLALNMALNNLNDIVVDDPEN